MTLSWHKNGKNLFSGGLDKTLKVWDKSLKPISKHPFMDSIGCIQYFDKTNSVGIAGYNKDLFISVWNYPSLNTPTHTIKGDNKQPILKFNCDKYFRKMISISKDNMIQVVDISDAEEDQRSIEGSMTVDQNDCVAFNFQKEDTNCLLYKRFSDSRSVYLDRYRFNSISKELIFYSEVYAKVQDDILEQLEHNAKAASSMENYYIRDKWLFIKSIHKRYKERSKEEKQKHDNDTYNLSDLAEYFRENHISLINDIKEKNIVIKDDTLFTSKTVDANILSYLSDLKDPYMQFDKLLFSQICMLTIQGLIDEGELIHGYHMYELLKDEVDLPKSTSMQLEHAYIGVLRDQQQHVLASNIIKKSKHRAIKEMNTVYTQFNLKCSNCKNLIDPNMKGECEKCKNKITCVICDKRIEGLIITCNECQHSSHFREILEWFDVKNKNAFCPAGCDHRCFTFEN